MCVVDGPLRLMEHMSFGVLELLTCVRIYVKSLVLACCGNTYDLSEGLISTSPEGAESRLHRPGYDAAGNCRHVRGSWGSPARLAAKRK